MTNFGEESTPEVVTNHLPAGRYEFKDSGLYIGEWLHEKAFGLGLLTKDKSQGEYTGYWHDGSECSGVFLWPSAPGAMYEGEWSKSKRHGYGKFVKEDWIVMGKFQDGFITLGVKTKENSVGKFEGEFEDGCPIFGMETYADGGKYYGDYKSGVREGYGVRVSVAYEEVFAALPENKKQKLPIIQKKKSSTLTNPTLSLQHTNLLPNGLGNELSEKNGGTTIDETNQKLYPNLFQCGFVLSGKRSDQLMKKLKHISNCKKHIKRAALDGSHSNTKKIKRSKSLTSVFSAINKRELYNNHFICMPDQVSNLEEHMLSKYQRDALGTSMGNLSVKTGQTTLTFQTVTNVTKDQNSQIPGMDYIGGDVVEMYSGQWVQDQRCGFGVALRSDGVSYEGSWLSNKRHGYGVTKFGDGTVEEGFYQNDKLVSLWTRSRNPFIGIYAFRLEYLIKKNVHAAREASKMAQDKLKECVKKLAEIREVINLATKKAVEARTFSLETRQFVKDLYSDYEQPGIKCLKDIVRNMRVTKRGQVAFETMLESAMDVIEGKGIPLLEDESDKQTNKQNNQNLAPKDNQLIMVDSHGTKRASRHGSFRRTKKVQAQEPVEEIIDPRRTLRTEARPSNFRDKLKVEQKLTSTRISPARSSPLHNARIVVEDTSVNINGSTENKEEQEDDGEFVTVDKIVATSEIPIEPLLNMLTNESMTDHFNHYGDKSTKQQNGEFDNVSLNIRSLPVPNRRSTVPEIMSQPPVSPKSVISTLCDCQEEFEEDEEEIDPDTIFVIQNGVRKRVSPINPLDHTRIQNSPTNDTLTQYLGNKDLQSSRVTLSPPQDHLSPLPVQFKFQSQLNLRKDLKEGSLPDISATMLRPGMPREEVQRLTDEYKKAMELNECKMKQGTIIIRLQRFKDIIANNILMLSVIFFNLIFILLLISFSYDSKNIRSQ